MEGGESGGRARLVLELRRVQELVRQLELQLHGPSTSVDLCRRLAHQIVALTERSIGMVRCADAATATAAHFPATPTPPLSGAPSPLSDAGSDQPFRGSPKKRKATARWANQVRLSAAGGAEGPADDGYCWRKYGQKDILGAKHPRAYYRCTHRNSQNCPATKQVQRTDDDPTLFDVVYHGEHTCRPGGGARRAQPQHNPHAQSMLQGLAAELTVTTDGMIGSAAVPPLTPESCPARGTCSPWSLASPVGSDSNGYLGVSQGPLAGYREWPSDGDLQEVVSVFAAVPALDAEFMAMPEYFGFDPSFDTDATDAMPSLFFP
ncbi:transcription factor WRKY19-like [Phragmites australis]|uniref:transcription factor WRKY19-like n=1 Tax=Phragmites australis TaxID=29695 RepID=UPI002D78C21D|nr:transcription factor WRKY19-like [Phragmites australis]